MGAPEKIEIDGAVRDRQCEKHGIYRQTYTALRNGPGGYWSGACSDCKREEAEERERRDHEEKLERIYGRSGMPSRYQGKRLRDFKPRTPLQRKALAACQGLADDWTRSAALLGPTGVGKTHLSCGVMHEAIHAYEIYARYITMADFLADIQGNWAWNGAKDEAQEYVRAPLLVLDEVWHPTGERDRESIVALIDARYREEQPTIICSNLTWPQLRESLGERPCDRLLEDGGQIIPLDGESYRRKSKGGSK